MTNPTDPQPADEPKYSPELEKLAAEMVDMGFDERCEALLKLANEQHAIGMKNGRFGFTPTTQVQRQCLEARLESLQWALNDYNMSDTDTRANLEGFISDLQQQLNGEKQ